MFHKVFFFLLLLLLTCSSSIISFVSAAASSSSSSSKNQFSIVSSRRYSLLSLPYSFKKLKTLSTTIFDNDDDDDNNKERVTTTTTATLLMIRGGGEEDNIVVSDEKQQQQQFLLLQFFDSDRIIKCFIICRTIVALQQYFMPKIASKVWGVVNDNDDDDNDDNNNEADIIWMIQRIATSQIQYSCICIGMFFLLKKMKNFSNISLSLVNVISLGSFIWVYESLKVLLLFNNKKKNNLQQDVKLNVNTNLFKYGHYTILVSALITIYFGFLNEQESSEFIIKFTSGWLVVNGILLSLVPNIGLLIWGYNNTNNNSDSKKKKNTNTNTNTTNTNFIITVRAAGTTFLETGMFCILLLNHINPINALGYSMIVPIIQLLLSRFLYNYNKTNTILQFLWFLLLLIGIMNSL